MKALVITVLTILLCLAVGKALAYLFGFLPASLYGMLLFTVVLSTGILDEINVAAVIAKMIFYMPIVFLPVCVGIIKHLELFALSGWKLVLIAMLTTLITMLITALAAQKLLPEAKHD